MEMKTRGMPPKIKAIVLSFLFFLVSDFAFSQDRTQGTEYPDSRGTKVFFPLGDLSFADEVASFEDGSPQSGEAEGHDPRHALGSPGGRTVWLGCHGTLTLEFIDNVLIDVDGPDLYVFETGPWQEPTSVFISQDGRTWRDVGKSSGGTGKVEISNFVRPGEEFRYVRLTDLECRRGCCHGADIDSVGAIGSLPRGTLALWEIGQQIEEVFAPTKIELILDASGSMARRMEDMMETAKDVLGTLVHGLPKGVEVGLRVYGHRTLNTPEHKERSCRDSEVVYPFSKLDKQALLESVAAIQPGGWTPIGYSLSQVKADFQGVQGERLVILVTDGRETCDEEERARYYPAKVVKSMVQEGVQIRVNVVGFAIGDERTKAQLREIAEITGGHYYDAKDSSQLEEALGRSSSAVYTVRDSAGELLAEGVIGGGRLSLPPGRYTVQIQSRPSLIIKDVEVMEAMKTRVFLSKTAQGVTSEIEVVPPSEPLPKEVIKGDDK